MTNHDYPFYDEPEGPHEFRIPSPGLEEVAGALRNISDKTLSTTLYYGLSGRSRSELEELKPVWMGLETPSRVQLLEALAEASESNFDLDYRELGILALQDPVPEIRKAAIELLWADETDEVFARLLDMIQTDDSAVIRARLLIEIGRFLTLGEYETIPQSLAQDAQEIVLAIYQTEAEDVMVRRRAVEALASSSHDSVPAIIEEAYYSGEPALRTGALFAMGRTCDSQWRDIVLQELSNSDDEARYEAVKAAGELELDDAVPALANIALEDDNDIQFMAIWSLGEIGSPEAVRILGILAEEQAKENPDLLEAIEDALAMASMAGSGLGFELDDDD